MTGEHATATLRGQLRLDEAMSRHVTWRAGGRAARAYFPADLADLCAFLASLRHDEPLLFVGLGSNLLVRDGGFDGTVVFTHGALSALRREAEDVVYAEAGVSSHKLARFAAAEGLVGAEFLAAVPGTVGGALVMNAGCYGDETWNHVVKVITIDRHGALSERSASDFTVSYRHVGLKAACDEWFAAARWRFAPGDPSEARAARIAALLERRMASQPLSLPNAGSVFRNPPGDYAARMIEAAGLKGYAIGGAQVSEKHANFIVNAEGRAKAADIEALIAHVEAAVRKEFGVALVREVRIVGDRRE